MIDVKALYGERLESLYRKYRKIADMKNGYGAQDFLNKNALLFVGINPSTNAKFSEIWNNGYYDTEKTREHYTFFKKTRSIAEQVGLPCSHIDLLFMRETRQKEIKTRYKKEDNYLEFIKDNLAISCDMIKQVRPKTIVVSNAFARDILFDNKDVKSGFTCLFDDDYGTYRMTAPDELKNIPVFCTSMLTGQRALDNGSFERLVWSIKYALRYGRNYSKRKMRILPDEAVL